VAVVPVSALDSDTSEALEYAATLSPRVVAIHLRTVAADALEREWSARGERSPLVVVDVSGNDSARAFRRVLDVLERSQQLNQITVVLPAARDLDLGDWSSASHGRAVVRPA
jgi:hypothetical protein